MHCETMLTELRVYRGIISMHVILALRKLSARSTRGKPTGFVWGEIQNIESQHALLQSLVGCLEIVFRSETR